jgi:hypothetical protein
MVIIDATLDRARKYEEELASMLKELEHLHHLEKYYQDSMQATIFLKSEFQDAYNKFTSERHLFSAGIANFQEDTLIKLATCKGMEIWYEKSHQAVERIDYISVVQKGRDIEEHGIQVLRDSNIDRIRKSVEYWVKMAQEPQREIQEKWVDCERRWTKINRAMRDIGLLEFGTLEDFVDLHDIVKLPAEQDSSWTTEIEKVSNMVPGQVQEFMEHPIKAQTVLQWLSVKVVKYRAWAVEIKEIISAPMDQHRFLYANTCEELFVKWS